MARTGVGSQTGVGGGGTTDIGKIPVDPNRPSQLSPKFYRDYVNHRLNQIRGQGVKAGPVPEAQSPLLSEPPLPYAQPATPSPEVARRVDAMGSGLSMGEDFAPFGNLQQYIPDVSHTISREQRENYQPSESHDRFQAAVDQAMDLPVVPYQRLVEQFGGYPPSDMMQSLEDMGYAGGDLTPRQYVAIMPDYMKYVATMRFDGEERDRIKEEVDLYREGIVDSVADGLKAKDGMVMSSLEDGGTPQQRLVNFATNNLFAALESGEFDGDFADPASISMRDRDLAGVGEKQLVTEGARKNAQRKVVGDLFRTFQDGGNAPDYAHWFPTSLAALNMADLENSEEARFRIANTMNPNVFEGRSEIALEKFERGKGATTGPTSLVDERNRPILDDEFSLNHLTAATHDPSYALGRYVGQPGMNALQTLFGNTDRLDARNQSSYMYNRPQPLHYDHDTQDSAAEKVVRANQLYNLGPERFNTYAIPKVREMLGGEPKLGTQAENLGGSILYGLTSNPWAAGTMAIGGSGALAAKGLSVPARVASATGGFVKEVGEEAMEEVAQTMAEQGQGPITVLKNLGQEKTYSPFLATPTYNIKQGKDSRSLSPLALGGGDYWKLRDEASKFWGSVKGQQDEDYDTQFGSSRPFFAPMPTGIQKYR